MIFNIFTSRKKADYYKLSFYNGFASKQNAAILGDLLSERFYSLRKLNKIVSKQVAPFGQYLLACLVVTKFDFEGEIVSQLNYFELLGETAVEINPKLVDDDVNYLSELLYSKPA